MLTGHVYTFLLQSSTLYDFKFFYEPFFLYFLFCFGFVFVLSCIFTTLLYLTIQKKNLKTKNLYVLVALLKTIMNIANIYWAATFL